MGFFGEIVASGKITEGDIPLSDITNNGYLTVEARVNNKVVSQCSVPIIKVNSFENGITIGSTTLTEANLIKLLELIEE